MQTWPSETTCFTASSIDITGIATSIFQRVCRTGFDQPGFCVVNLGDDIDSRTLRHIMIEVQHELAILHEKKTGQSLVYLSAGRFDQQTSTRPHLDGGPDESLLMLGYEPSEVTAELEISDYARCAFDMGITPKQFMEQHNPMFHSGYAMLRPYTHSLECFDPADFQIVAINNSSAPIDGSSWLGTLHTATIRNPDDSKRRVINSTMIAPAAADSMIGLSSEALEEFANTTLIHRKGYDRTHLEDDH